ncbi:MAG: hypothetical protein Q4D79_11665 [Propionibacteriaceae bacterium]|nr:hypothetical protein [Propionibacteriaceae bacterium]
MKATRILAALAAATTLFAAGAQAASADVNTQAAAPTVTIDVKDGTHQAAELNQGDAFIAKTICPDGYKNFQLRLGDKIVGGGTVAEGAAGVKVQPAANQVGKQTLTAMCAGYNDADKTASVDLNIQATRLFIDPTSWKAGDEVTLTGFGFTPGESVSLDMVRDSDGKSYWSAANVATAGENGVFQHKLVLKSDVPQGNYTVNAKGAQSGLTLALKFYWGQPDSGSDDKAPGKSAPGAGNGQNNKKVGLPHTGA